MFQVKVFWVVTPYSVAVGYQRFRGSYCVHLSQHCTAAHPRRARTQRIPSSMLAFSGGANLLERMCIISWGK